VGLVPALLGPVKLLLTVFASIVLLVKMELIDYTARLSAEATLPVPIFARQGSNS